MNRGMPLIQTHFVLLLLTCAVAMATTTPGRSAETAAGASVASLISGGPAEDLRPVTVIDRSDIDLSGMRNMWDLLLSRDWYNFHGLDRPLNLGASRIAVLINGRRITDSLYDLDSLPVSAVERIEILSGSAVALHGPQAISGAINIVLRHEFDGVETQVSGETPDGAGGEAAMASALWGGAVGAGHMTVGADVFRRNEIRARPTGATAVPPGCRGARSRIRSASR